MDLKGLPQTVQNFIEETIQNRENGKFPDNETCQKVMEYAADTGSQKLAGLGLYYLAEYYWQNDQYENTLQCLTESIGYLKNEQMYELLARTYNMMGAVSDRKNNRMVALSSYYNCLQYAENTIFIISRAWRRVILPIPWSGCACGRRRYSITVQQSTPIVSQRKHIS